MPIRRMNRSQSADILYSPTDLLGYSENADNFCDISEDCQNCEVQKENLFQQDEEESIYDEISRQ